MPGYPLDRLSPGPRTIYLVRHCAASGQAPDAPLTGDGRETAHALAAALCGFGIQRILSSPYRRAVETAQPLAERLGLPVTADARLVERVLTPTPVPDWRERLVASFTDLDLRIDGGESGREAMRRGCAVLSEVLEHPDRVTVVITHGNLLTLLLKSLDRTVGFAEWERMSNPDVYRVDYQEAGAVVQRLQLQ